LRSEKLPAEDFVRFCTDFFLAGEKSLYLKLFSAGVMSESEMQPEAPVTLSSAQAFAHARLLAYEAGKCTDPAQRKLLPDLRNSWIQVANELAMTERFSSTRAAARPAAISDGNGKSGQADAKSVHKAKEEQAA
jgi:hypothetical protein